MLKLGLGWKLVERISRGLVSMISNGSEKKILLTSSLNKSGFIETFLPYAHRVQDRVSCRNHSLAFDTAAETVLYTTSVSMTVTIPDNSLDLPSVGTGHTPPHVLGQYIASRMSTPIVSLHKLHRQSKLYVAFKASRRFSRGRVVSM